MDKEEEECAEAKDQEDTETQDVDHVIENAARRANLSVLNVKSILHHVLKDKRVLSVVQRKAAEEEGEGPAPPIDDLIEPRLTRSRVREAVASAKSTTMSPDKVARMRAIAKSPTKTGSLSAEELLNCGLGADESSDEEYIPPDKEGVELSEPDSEEEEPPKQEASLSPTSADPSTPPYKEATPPSEDAVVKETAALLASLPDIILSPIRGQSSREENELVEEEIARRTRSKFPLNDTPLSAIEGSFQPPDAEDPSTPAPLELDEDDLEWHQWLNDLMNPPDSQLGVSVDEGEDTEYNYLAEQDVVEKEELRNDRAVKIPRKEVDELLNELLYPPSEGLGGLLGEGGLDPTSAYLLESLGLQTPVLQGTDGSQPLEEHASTEESVGCYLSLEQTRQLSEQVNQHFQLLMQTFVLCRYEPSLLFLSQVAAQALDELSSWSQEAEQGSTSAVWYVPDAQGGVELIQRLDPNDEHAVTMTTSTSNRIPDGAQEILMSTPLFWRYPSLLPAVGLAPINESRRMTGYFSNAEDCLLVLGMDHYGSVAWQQIKANVLPTKTVKQLQLRVKNQNSKRTGDNVIKHYKKTKQLKIPFTEENEKSKDLPQWIMQYNKKRLEKEKEAKKTTEELAKQTTKLRKILDIVPRTLSRLRPRVPASEASSKRNLMATLEEAGNIEKKPRVDEENIDKNEVVATKEDSHPRKRRKERARKRPRTVSSQQVSLAPPTSPTHCSMEHLLLAAGLEPGDPNARFAHSYITEVKRTVSSDKFSQFLSILVSADKNKWRPSKTFQEVQGVLEPWPHLVKLFTELLRTEDCLEANAVADKMEVANIREFATKLKEQFGDSPLDLKAVLDRLHALDTPTLTQDKVEHALLPLIMTHEELVGAMRRFLYQLPPTVQGDCWDNVDMNSTDDQFENITFQSTPVANATDKTEEPAISSQSDTTQWMRQEDGVILKQCLPARHQSSMDAVFAQVAASISRTPQEVEARFTELMDLLHSSKK